MPPVRPHPALGNAAVDLRYLLARGYPREGCLGLVGNQYTLNNLDRQILRRGVQVPAQARARAAKRRSLTGAAGEKVGVDGHNVIITVESALKGTRLVLADDGWIRDISQVGRNHRPDEITYQAAGLMVSALKKHAPARVEVWLDQPLPRSGELAKALEDMLISAGLEGRARTAPVPEKELWARGGLLASSDTAVVDRTENALDLAGEIIRSLDPEPIWEVLEYQYYEVE